ncbi:MAG: helix-turn-helix domain-containing protein [Oscillospiraceae bacterium]|nr:helix-turn-helix domain-containing protein [Oscillospiraceae bacterium]
MVKYDSREIVRRIDLRLAELGISKAQFYAESGVSSATISQWNNNVCVPTAKKLQQVANYLHMSVYDLTGSDGTPTYIFKDTVVDGAKMELFELIDSLDDRQCRRVINILENILQMIDDK